MKQPVWMMILLILFESFFILTLVPSNWTQQVVEKESALLESRLGSKEHEWVHAKAKGWFDASLIDSGVYQWIYDLLIPTSEQIENSKGMEDMGNVWFDWLEERIQANANAYYHMLSRFALLLTWLPLFGFLAVIAMFDGERVWRIKRTNYDFSSPLLSKLSSRGMLTLVFLMIALFLAPIVLDPLVIPVIIMAECILAGLLIGNLQKRI